MDSAMFAALWVTAAVIGWTWVESLGLESPLTFLSIVSVLSMIRFIISTTTTGWSPMAVSPLSIQASAPSRIALATSLASARVGRRL